MQIGLKFEVVESVPVPEDITLGNEKAPQLIENYCETIRRLGEALQQPRLPDKGNCMNYDFSLPASAYLEEDLRQIQRICRVEKE